MSAGLEYEQYDDSEPEAGYLEVTLYEGYGVMQHTSVPMLADAGAAK